LTYPLILLVEDDAPLRQVLFLALRSYGYGVALAGTGAEALTEAQARKPDAMLLDLGLPDMDGLQIITTLRTQLDLPIIVLSANNDEQQQIRALDAGANDYVTKPFREGELMARLRAAMRRNAGTRQWQELRVGDLRLDLLERRVFVGSSEVELTPTEFRLLHLLAREAGRVVTHRRLLREVAGAAVGDDAGYVRVFVKQIRKKIEREPAQPQRLVTVTGVGYRLTSTAAP